MRRPSLAVIFVCAAAVAATASLGAKYAAVETENVPVDRLVTNLEALVAASPQDARLKLNLARVHAMAFAANATDLPVWRGHPAEGVWFGNSGAPGETTPAVPFGPVKPRGAAQGAVARAHLAAAIQLYSDLIAAAARLSQSASNLQGVRTGSMLDLNVRLGHAWCVEQSGDRVRAIAEYRDVLNRAWEVERQQVYTGLEPALASEAFDYLRPLLDLDKDRAELARWGARIGELSRERSAQLSRRPRAITPVAIPLRQGMTLDEVIDPAARVRFDADGSGLLRLWTWIGRDAGWLVYDQRGTRDITSGLQWFGGVTFWLFWQNGYEPIRALDDNRDGRLTGAELRHLAIWRDADQNGVTDRGEFAPLAAWDIVALSSHYEVPDDSRVAAVSPDGVTFGDGTSRPTWDVLLRVVTP